jgi:hypothetical protein
VKGKKGVQAPPNRWFERRRDFFVRKVLEDFFSMYRSFQDVYELYLACRNPFPRPGTGHFTAGSGDSLAGIRDRLAELVGSESRKGPLWQLKDLCHLVWPEETCEQDRSGCLVDWLTGSIFHETMKLKENVYLLGRYGSAAYKIREYPADIPVTAMSARAAKPRLENMVDINGVITRAAADAVRQMEQIAYLFVTACYMLRMILPRFAGNALVVRLLIEQEEMVRRFWSEEAEDLFNDMYCGDAAEGFCIAGRSYLQGQWFVKALQMYRKAIQVNPTCDEAITRTVQLQQIVSENKELLVGAI